MDKIIEIKNKFNDFWEHIICNSGKVGIIYLKISCY